MFYSYNYVFNSVDLAKKWWGNIAKEWKAKYPTSSSTWLASAVPTSTR